MLYYATAYNPKLTILRKKQNGFKRCRYLTSKILTIRRILEAVRKKNPIEATILFVDFAKTFDYIHRRKIEQILHANGLPKKKKNCRSYKDAI